MAAYAALVSLMHIIDQIQHHPRPPISIDEKQAESLTRNATFLQDFLESYNTTNVGSEEYKYALESRIADAVYAAEDIIESHIVDQIPASYSTTSDCSENVTSSIDLYQGLQNVIQDLDLIEKELVEIKETTGVHDQLLVNSISAGSLRYPSTEHNTLVCFDDDVLIEIMDTLTGQPSHLQSIPITGMGGIGKTTLARNIYANPLIVQHFYVLAWATISQEYNAKEILSEVILCVKTIGSKESLSRMSEHELGEILHKSLSGRKYLIIIDDIWSIEAWNEVRLFIPDNNNGSRIIITTRLSSLAFEITGSHGFKLNFLDKDRSWSLLRRTVFGEQGCPLELEETGKRIAENCKGLPLSIIVIGGLLEKSKPTQEYWEYVGKNLNSIVNLSDDERCLKILQTSYNWLPVHLKPCFLYMGLFREDSAIRVSDLIELWVAEGFLKPIPGKNPEVVAEEYLKELIDRNLVLIHRQISFSGKIKFCNIHDLLRDLCLREARTSKFLCVTRQHDLDIPHGIQTQRRIGIHAGTRPQAIDALPSLAHSLICDIHFQEILPLLNFRLLRVLRALRWINQKTYFEKRDDRYRVKAIFELVNSRYVSIDADGGWLSKVPSSIVLLWNLQTLVITGKDWITAPPEIWKMPQLRHIKFDELCLPNPPTSHACDEEDGFVLENLQTLLKIREFKCGQEVAKRIPNVKKLKIFYCGTEGWSRYHLNNLDALRKLESLGCYFYAREMQHVHELISFPHSLRELTLEGCRLDWDEVTVKIGSLPHLEVLKLKVRSVIGTEWETVEGRFGGLRKLLISKCDDLELWTTESTHFPRLEHLRLKGLYNLKEIPLDIGEISTLQSLELAHCSDSAKVSARRMVEEQEEMGNVGLKLRIT